MVVSARRIILSLIQNINRVDQSEFSSSHSTSGWRPNSPDLSPIENLWGYVKYQLKSYNIKNLKSLKQKIREIRDGFTVGEQKNLITSIPEPLEAVIKNDGDHSGY